MTETATMTPEPQRLRALERANEVRLARAELKRRIASGGVSAAQVILDCPGEAHSWSVQDLLMSQRRWGRTRCRKFLVQNEISEVKQIGTLTERQRRMLASKLVRCEVDTVQVHRRIQPALEHHIETPVGTPDEGSTISSVEAEKELELVGA
jgi:hypothetical protein